MTEEQWYAETAEEDAEMRRYWAEIEECNKAWVFQWPNHCASCGGWGCSNYPATGPSYSYGGPGGFDVCEALPEGTCHRCGMEDAMLLVTGDFKFLPCKFCGWNFDDGVATAYSIPHHDHKYEEGDE